MFTTPLIHPVFDQTEIDNLRTCLASGHVTQGPFVAKFERKFAESHGALHAAAVTSCTAALHLALMALGIGHGHEVIVPALTWVATANVVELTGARPVFVDVIPETFTIDPQKAAAAVTPRTRAIIPVHLFGLCADMHGIAEIARRHGLAVIEDAACATGSSFFGAWAGTLGDAGCFSFHPRKVITTGEGGMVTTGNTALHSRILALRNHGAAPDTQSIHPWQMAAFPFCGLNYRLSDLQGAVGCAQMDKMPAILAERQRIAMRYTELLQSRQDIFPPHVPAGHGHSWQSYVIRLTDDDTQRRNKIMSRMAEAGIETRPGTHAVHRLAYFSRKYDLSPDMAPNAVLCEDCTIALPMVHGMTEGVQQRVVRSLNV